MYVALGGVAVNGELLGVDLEEQLLGRHSFDLLHPTLLQVGGDLGLVDDGDLGLGEVVLLLLLLLHPEEAVVPVVAHLKYAVVEWEEARGEAVLLQDLNQPPPAVGAPIVHLHSGAGGREGKSCCMKRHVIKVDGMKY